jgi:predicted phage terminase large subunit-like protein
MMIERQVLDLICRNCFGAFVYAAFKVVYPGQDFTPNWHIDCVCHQLEKMVTGQSAPHLVLNQPPRSLKSFIVSVCLPAWLLGRNPTRRIICASYAEDLANKFSRDCRALMASSFYKRIFPETKLNRRKTTESEFETTRRGFRLATSIGGVLTGRGGDALIIDDPIKANDANSQVALSGATEWFRNTALSRLDDRTTSLIIVTQQRLHVLDLSGILTEAGWPKLVLPAIATEPEDYAVSSAEFYHRPVGELLQPARDTPDDLEEMRRTVGSHIFAAQFQQNPTPPEGNMIKAVWLQRYENLPKRNTFRRVTISCDPAGKVGTHNDYSAIAVLGFDKNVNYVFEVKRGRWGIMQLKDQITTIATQWRPELIIIEDTSSGMSLIPLLREQTRLSVVGRRPKDSKEARMARHAGRIEAGRVLLPREAHWLADFESELLAFPNGRYDDQVDALMLYLDWLSENETWLTPAITVLPIIISKPWIDRFANNGGI